MNRSKIVLAVLFAGLAAVPAFATVEVRVTDSTGTYTQIGTPGVPNGSALLFNFNDAAFTVNLQVALSNAPNGPAVLAFSTNLVSATGSLGTPNPLKIEISDTGYLLPSGFAVLTQNVNTTTPANGQASGTLTGTGYYGTGAGNVFFCQATAVCSANTPPLPGFTSFDNSNPGQTTTALINFVPPFSLDEVLMASFTSPGNAQFQGNLSAVAVPEPASVILLGGVLLFTVSVIRKRKLNRA